VRTAALEHSEATPSPAGAATGRGRTALVG